MRSVSMVATSAASASLLPATFTANTASTSTQSADCPVTEMES